MVFQIKMKLSTFKFLNSKKPSLFHKFAYLEFFFQERTLE